MVQQLKITFFHYLYKTNSKGEAPIFCRIAIGDKKQQFSTGLYLNASQWDKSSHRAKGKSDDIMLINRKLQEIHSQFIKIEKQLYDEGEQVTLRAIYSRYKGKETDHTLCSVFDERIAKMEALVGAEYSNSTLQKFREVYSHVKGFIHTFNGQQDVSLKQLNFSFIK